jgi:osmotically-inducible protein OsmY
LVLFTIFYNLKFNTMADNNRNRGSYRNTNQDWNENQGRNGRNQYDERQYGSSENRGYGNSSGFEDDSSGWQNRYQREESNNRSGERYGVGRTGRYDEGEGSYGIYNNERESNYGNFSGSDRSNRGLYDRDYEGITRSGYSNSGSRIGGANYGSYGDRGRFANEGDRNFGNSYGGYSGSNYGGNFGTDYNSGSPGRRNQEDRSWWDRASDEVSSWFGNEDAENRRNRDRQMSHKGKGPKNYSRSDDRIKEDVNDRLSDDPFVDASEIEVTVSAGEVTLTGTVDHRSNKRRAEDLAESVSGVKNVENRIRVAQPSANRAPEKSTDTFGSSATSSSTTSAVPGSDRNRKKDYVTG